MSKEEFKSRRSNLLKDIDKNSVVVVFSAQEAPFRGYPYHQNSDFYYLTGFVEPESVAVLIPDQSGGSFILFNRERDFAKEVWCGPYIGQEGACLDFGADRALSISEFDKVLPELLVGRENIYSNVGSDDPRYQKIEWCLSRARDEKISYNLMGLGEILHEMRLRKSQHELDIIRKAVDITVNGHLRAMRKCRSGIYEFELEAELLYEFIRLGGRYSAFEVIVASGENACTLHYSKNSKKMVSGELVLVDAGIKYDHYCTDVTRTFPVEGGFTPEQRAIYEIVLEAQKKVVKEICPGVLWSHLQSIAEHVITEGLIDVGILRGSIESLLEQGSFKPFFMHKIGHWIGLDTHDVGGCLVDNNGRILEPNMVFTVEPGIYISQFADVDSRWKGIGVRIEDNVLVTDDGSEVLTKGVPSSIIELEGITK